MGLTPKKHDAPQGHAAALLAAAPTICLLTGAGLSTDSGIPDFRGPQGLWTKNPQAARMFDINAYVQDPDLRVTAWQNRRDHPAWTAQPNPAHMALAELEAHGRVRAVITQNIDGLHQAAGSGQRAPVVEVHGSLRRTICLGCGDTRDMRETLRRLDAGEVDPKCLQCSGLLKSDTISFGQGLDPQTWGQAQRFSREAQVLWVLGTSLQVNPVASLVPMAWQTGVRIIINNAEATPYDDIADVVIREPLRESVPALVQATLENST